MQPLQLDDSSVRVAGKCSDTAFGGQRDYSVAGAGKGARGSLAGNYLTLNWDVKCPSNATQRSTAACQAFCSITDNGPCDGRGACVPPAPGARGNFTCACDGGYSPVDVGNGSTCAIVNATTTAVIREVERAGPVRTMATLHHVNLVRLLGFCQDQNVETGKQEQILVYEFVANRDLHHHLYKTKTDMHAKVADFGLLKLLTHGDADATRVAGTPGYVDPDYNRSNVITSKSDVFRDVCAAGRRFVQPFSCLPVLLELLSGTPPTFHRATHIKNWAQKRVDAYEFDELKDSKLEASEEAVVDFADLALDCIKAPGTRRPDMKDVAYRLCALIDKHCPDNEEERESGRDENASTREESSTTKCSTSGSSFFSSCSDSFMSWLGLRFR
ncbi:unnamed protein product [Closterium sp. Naga37s-1]|nr:unnamed protein product [Closterium sp. Naga37s-1]